MSDLVNNVWNKIVDLMDGSLFFRSIDHLLVFIKTLFSGSVFAVITKETDDKNLTRSVFVRIIIRSFQCVSVIRDAFFAEAFANSALVGFVRKTPAYLFGSAPAAVASCAAIAVLAANTLSGKYLPDSPASVSILLICVILVFISLLNRNLTIGDMLSSSKFVSIALKMLSLDMPAQIRTSSASLVFCSLLGIPLGVLFHLFPLRHALAIFVGVPGVLMVAAYPVLGILAVIGSLPFLPTMVLAAMLGYTVLCFLLKLFTDRNYSCAIDLTGVFLSIYIACTMFMGFASFDRNSSIKIALLTTLFMSSYFLMVSLFTKKRHFDLAVFVFSLSSAFAGLYGLYQKYSGHVDMTWVDRDLFSGLKLRVFSTFDNPNVYGAYLLLAIPLCCCMILYSKTLLAKMYYAGVSFLLAINLALTYSRGCYIALVFAAVVFVLFMERRLITLLSIAIFALPFILPPGIINRVLSITNLSDSSTTYRISIWQATLRIIRDFWFVGLGQGIDAYNKVYPLYRFNSVSAPHSHNLYLQIFVELGILGLIIFVALLLSFYKTHIPSLNKSRSLASKAISAGLMAAVMGFLLQGVFDYVFYNNRLHLAFFIVIGLGNAFVRIGKDGTQ